MKKVCQYTQDMVLVATYPSTRKAASAVGMSPTAISLPWPDTELRRLHLYLRSERVGR